MNEMREEMRHLFSQLLQNNPRLNIQDIPGCAGSNHASHVNASSAQAIRGKNLPHSSGPTHASVPQKLSSVGRTSDEKSSCGLFQHVRICLQGPSTSQRCGS